MHFKRDLGHSHLKFQDTKQKEYQVLITKEAIPKGPQNDRNLSKNVDLIDGTVIPLN